MVKNLCTGMNTMKIIWISSD